MIGRARALGAAVLSAVASLGGPAAAQEHDPQPAPAASRGAQPWLVLHLDPLADLMFEAAFATQPPSPFSAPPPVAVEGEPGLESLDGGDAALAAARRLHVSLNHPLAWGLLAAALEGCEDSFEWSEKLEALPEPAEVLGRPLSIRADALEFALALGAVEEEFRAAMWPARRARLQQARAGLEKGLMAKADEIYADLDRSLGLEMEPPAVPVFLIWNHLSPGAATYLRDGGGGICFVGVAACRAVGSGALEETVVHESLHGLDILTPAGRGALEGLRTRLRAAGIEPRDRRFRDVPHGLMFVAAGEAIRRHLDPGHRHYGDQVGLYRRLGVTMQCTRVPWTAFLDGECGREEALDRAIDTLLADQGPR